MPNIYITEETKMKLDVLSKAENRTQTGEIEHLLGEQAKRMDIDLEKEIENNESLSITKT